MPVHTYIQSKIDVSKLIDWWLYFEISGIWGTCGKNFKIHPTTQIFTAELSKDVNYSSSRKRGLTAWLLDYIFIIMMVLSEEKEVWLLDYIFIIRMVLSEEKEAWLLDYIFIIRMVLSEENEVWLLDYISIIRTVLSEEKEVWLLDYIFIIKMVLSEEKGDGMKEKNAIKINL